MPQVYNKGKAGAMYISGKTMLFFVFAGLWIFQSCEPKPHSLCGDPPPQYIGVALVDSNDNLLIGPVYNPDSIKLTLDNKPLEIHFDKGYIVIYYGGMDIYNLRNYLLYLNYKDTDTLNLAVSGHYDDQCGSYYYFSGLKYNSKTVGGYHLYYKIIK
jgi:hypothetical protein